MLLYQLATGHYVSRALLVAAKLGIADLLKDGPRHYSELAKATETHAPSLNRLMRLLASAGVLTQDDEGDFGLTPLGECLRVGVPGSSRAMVMHFAGNRIQQLWKDLEYSVRTGEPAYRLRGVTDPFLDPLRTPEEEANFDAAMADLTRLAAVAVAAVYDFTPFDTVVDVGGGNGALMIGILKPNPKLKGIVFDQPAAAERATAQISQNNLAERCQAIGGDFFKEVPAGGDAYLLKHVIHDWDDQRAVTILRNCHRAMTPQGKLLIVEGVYPKRIDQSAESRAATANDVNMLVATGGRQRSEDEFRSLYQAAGFRLTTIVPTVARVSIVEGVPV
ncbi:MAG TPA: methyltransferase [Candidatus Binataceae bacterium]|nr:methyltransferase [Candidatus Binataceae bacterium]